MVYRPVRQWQEHSCGGTRRSLHEMGILSFRLDGDNVRMGINKNLGFSAEDRTENIRRIGEVAKLFVDSGVIALSSFISPYRADRDQVRALHEAAGMDFIEIFVDCSLAAAESRDQKACTKKPGPARSRILPGLTTLTRRLPSRKFTCTLTNRLCRRKCRKFSAHCVSAASSASNQENRMIKPHGSDELNPLFVYDSTKRTRCWPRPRSCPPCCSILRQRQTR